ncbi:MAG: hypothetical protein Q9227_008250 [Pyrenula ochraceoflavens]
MLFTTVFLSALSLASASAINKPRQGSTASVYLCTDANFQGTCQNMVPAFNTCTNLAAPYDNSVSSVGPADGNFCRFFKDPGCSDQQAGVDFFDVVGSPGISDLKTYDNGVFNDQISSFQCSVWTGAAGATPMSG